MFYLFRARVRTHICKQSELQVPHQTCALLFKLERLASSTAYRRVHRQAREQLRGLLPERPIRLLSYTKQNPTLLVEGARLMLGLRQLFLLRNQCGTIGSPCGDS